MGMRTSFFPFMLFAMTSLIILGENSCNINTAATISIAHIQAEQGEFVYVPVTVTGFQQVSCIELHFQFNANVLDAFHDNPIIGNLHPLLNGSCQSNLINDSTIVFSWYTLNPVNLLPGAKLFDLRFLFCNDNLQCAQEGSFSEITLLEGLSTVHTGTFFNGGFPQPLPFSINPGSVTAHTPLVFLDIQNDHGVSVYVNGVPYYTSMVVESGATVNLQASVDEGFVFQCWCKDGNVLSNEISFDYTIPSESATIFAHTAQDMILYSLTLIPDPDEGGNVSGAGEYNAGDCVVIEALPNNGYTFIAWTDVDDNVISTNPCVDFAMPDNDLQLKAAFEPLNTLYIHDVTIAPGETECYDSEYFIVTAGDGTIFLVENGSVVNMVAGQSIIFKPGTTIKSGSNLWAYIDEESPYCDSPIHYHHDENSSVAYDNHQSTSPDNDVVFQSEAPGITVFPNPTSNHFNLLLEGFLEGDPISVEIYDVTGERVLYQHVSACQLNRFSLQSRSPGIYFVRVSGNDFYEVQRIVKK